MTTAISDMETAYTDAAGRTSPDFTELGTGDISGMTLSPGLYKWGTGVLITSGVTLMGSENDVWIFQIAQDLTVGNGAIVSLSGGAQAKNIFWQVAGETTLGTTSDFKGSILSKTLIAMNTGATLNGRALAQTAVTLQTNAVTLPTSQALPTVSIEATILVREGESGSTTTADVIVSMSSALGVGVTVDYATGDIDGATEGVDYTNASDSLTIAVGETSATIQVTVIGDDVQEPNESFTITISNVSSTAGALTITRATSTVTIIDDDSPGVDIPLGVGFNLVGFPVQFLTTTRAVDLAQVIGEQGGNLISILGWKLDSQTFDFWTAAAAQSNNFQVQSGGAYFVRLTKAPAGGIARLAGTVLADPVTFGLSVGFNLLSISVVTPAQGYNAQSLAAALDGVGASTTLILGWKSDSQTFDAWFAAAPDSNPFDIDPTAGYFIRTAQAVTDFTP